MKKRVLLVHNSMAEYRIAFWTYLTNLCDLTLIVTNKGLEEKIYKFKNNNQSITSLYLEDISKSQLKEIIKINNIIILPNNIFIYLLLAVINFPNVLANIPNKTNIIVNPKTNPKEFIIVFFKFLSWPAKYDTYIGNIGNTHGDKKDAIPSINIIKKFIFFLFKNFLFI